MTKLEKARCHFFLGQFHTEDKDTQEMYSTALNAIEAWGRVKADIQEVKNINRTIDSENARCQIIALDWCLEIIDKYLGEIG